MHAFGVLFFPPVTFPLSVTKPKTLRARFPHNPGLYVGHSSCSGKRTPCGVYSFGSCIVILYPIQTLVGKESSSPQMAFGIGDPVTVAQKCGGAIFKMSELGLRICLLPKGLQLLSPADGRVLAEVFR